MLIFLGGVERDNWHATDYNEAMKRLETELWPKNNRTSHEF